MSINNRGMRRAQREINDMLKELAVANADRETVPPDTVIEVFGVPSLEGSEVQSGWKINSLRTDKRHGFVGTADPQSDYSKSLLKTMFGGWNQ